MSDIESSNWSETAASNNQMPPNGAPEGMAPSTVNDTMREMMAALKRDWNHQNATQTSAGTNTITLTYSVAPAAYVTGQTFAFKAGGTNTGTATLNVNGLGAKNIFWGGAALVGFEIVANAFYAVSYDGTQFNLIWSSLCGQPQTGAGKNVPINGDCEIWQRGAGGSASIAVSASTVIYGPDRAYVSAGVNEATTLSQQAGLTNGSRYCCRVQRNNGQTGTATMVFGFPLTTDQVVALRGQKVTVSAVLRAGANWSPASGNITMNFNTGTGAETKRGAGFTGDMSVASQTNAITTTATRYAVTSAGTVPTNATQGEVNFGWTPVGTAGAADYFEIDEVQLEIGSAPTPFERRSFQDELARCQRFYWKTFPYGTAPAQNAGTGDCWQFSQAVGASTNMTASEVGFKVHMRIAPTATAYNPSAANAQVRNSGTATDCTNTTLIASPWGFYATLTSPVGSAAGQALQLHGSFDADL